MADKPFTVLYDYSDVPTLKKFALCNKRVRCAMGPFGCLRGDTLVVTEAGLQPIAQITPQTLVLSWNETTKEFVYSVSGGAYPKGRDFLYQVSTPRGEFVAAGHHRVFSAGYKYLPVSGLRPGDALARCSFSRLRKFLLGVRKLSVEGEGRSPEKFSYFQDRCARLVRRYGQQPLWVASTDPDVSPLSDDARTIASRFCLGAFGRKDDLEEQLREHIRQGQFYDRIQIDGFYPHIEHRHAVVEVHTERPLFAHIYQTVREFLRHPLKNLSHHTKKLFAECFHSCSSPLSDGTILSVKKLDVKEEYWDMHVFGTNNYVTVDGTIHHNSGKSSACVMEIIRRAHEQRPSPDGIRRSRWAVVRNSYGQLKDTTIKTFHDWFPPRLFGEYRVTDHMYIITKFPNVHLEILFRALDRPDQVSNLLSLELTGAWFNEVREIPRTIIEAMDGRIGRYPSGRDGGASWYGIIMDTNPPDESSYLYKMFERVRPETWEMFKQPSGLSIHAENTLHLPKGYYEKLVQGKDDMYKRIYVDGQYGYYVTGKPVFQSFVDNVHVARNSIEPQKGLDVVVGFDFGLTPACVIGQITPFGQLLIMDELVSDGMGLKQFCENQLLPLLRRKYFGMHVMGFGDPSGASRMPTDESTCFEILQGHEVGLRDVLPCFTNSIIARIGAVEAFLNKMFKGEPGFLLSPNCNFLRKAFNGGYHYEKDPKATSGDEFKPVPAKNFSSHISDALQYLCLFLQEHDANEKKWKAFSAQLKDRQHRPASNIAGY